MLWWIEVPAITQCKVLIAINTKKSLGQALELLKNHKEYSESVFNKLRVIEILVLQARAFFKLKRVKDAKEALNYALELTTDDNFIRPFVEGGIDLKDLLLEFRQQEIKIDFIELILSKLTNSQNFPIQDTGYENQVDERHSFQYTAFTRKEVEVLHCVSKGLRNMEIADKLFNSEMTIKKHLSNMFQKLEVKNRLSLVAKAKELGILK
jgi:LuxR family maltose regulon positive regulatory protein